MFKIINFYFFYLYKIELMDYVDFIVDVGDRAGKEY